MAEIKQIQVGSTAYDIAAKYILDNSSTPVLKSWTDIVSLVNTAKLKFLVCSNAGNTPKDVTFTPKGSSTPVTGTLAAASGDTTTFYLVYHPHDDIDAYDEYVTTGTVWEKIGNTDVDLSGYQKTGITLTTTTPSVNVTSSAGEQTANGTATVTYDKASNQTQSAGGATVNGSNFTFTGTTATITMTTNYKPAGSITGSQAVSAHSHTVNAATANAVTGVKNDGTVSVVTGYSDFSGGNASGTFVTSAIKNVKLSSSATTSTGAVTYVESISGSAPSLGGTKTFNTDAIKSVTLSNDATSTTGPTYVQSISGNAPSLGGTTSFNTDAIKTASLTGTTTFGTSFTVSNGILSLSTGTVGITTTVATKASVTISGGSYTATTKYMKATGNAAATGTVTISGGSYTASTKYLTGSGDAASTGSVSWSPASLGDPSTATVIKSTGLTSSAFMTGATLDTAGAVTINGSNFGFSGTTASITLTTDYQPAGSIGGSQAISAHTHGITLTATTITGTVAVAVTAHTHDLGNHTHNVTTSNS